MRVDYIFFLKLMKLEIWRKKGKFSADPRRRRLGSNRHSKEERAEDA